MIYLSELKKLDAKKKVVRLISIQGPTQLLNVLSILRSQETNPEYKESQDYLIIGGLCVDSLSLKKIEKICQQIARVWNFKQIFCLNNLERLYILKIFSFKDCIKSLKKSTNLEFVDAVYVCRNWQFFNEVLLSSYPQAHKICYGDGLGYLDLNSNFWSQPVNPEGLVDVDEICVIAPVAEDATVFNRYPIQQIHPNHFCSVVLESAKQISGLEKYCRELSKNINDSLTVVLTSNHTEAGIIKDYKNELDCYLSCILPYTQENELILVKGHPRQQLHQSTNLVKKLRTLGRNALEIDRFNRISIELFIPFLHINKLISFSSSSCVSATYLAKIEQVIIGYGEQIINNYFSSRYQKRILLDEQVFFLLTQQAQTGHFKPVITLEVEKQLDKFHEFSLQVNNQKNSDYETLPLHKSRVIDFYKLKLRIIVQVPPVLLYKILVIKRKANLALDYLNCRLSRWFK